VPPSERVRPRERAGLAERAYGGSGAPATESIDAAVRVPPLPQHPTKPIHYGMKYDMKRY